MLNKQAYSAAQASDPEARGHTMNTLPKAAPARPGLLTKLFAKKPAKPGEAFGAPGQGATGRTLPSAGSARLAGAMTSP